MSGFKNLIGGTFILGSSRFIEFFLSLLRTKVSAVFLGLTGIGILNQTNFLSNKLGALTLLSMNEALLNR